uniref:Uncharacterized protein n=1 Tax=Arundo donax TaxID=35708 RepID=A0A0A9GLY7_ARUDO
MRACRLIKLLHHHPVVHGSVADGAHHEAVLVALTAPLHLAAGHHHLAAAAALPARHEPRAAAPLAAAAVLGRACLAARPGPPHHLPQLPGLGELRALLSAAHVPSHHEQPRRRRSLAGQLPQLAEVLAVQRHVALVHGLDARRRRAGLHQLPRALAVLERAPYAAERRRVQHHPAARGPRRPPLGASLERVPPPPLGRAVGVALVLAVAHQERVVLHDAQASELWRRWLPLCRLHGAKRGRRRRLLANLVRGSHGRRLRRLLLRLSWLFLLKLLLLLLLLLFLLLLLGRRRLGVGLLGVEGRLHVLEGPADLGPGRRGELVALELVEERERHDGVGGLILILVFFVIGLFVVSLFLCFITVVGVLVLIGGDEPWLLDSADVEEGDARGRRAVDVGHRYVPGGLGARAPHGRPRAFSLVLN